MKKVLNYITELALDAGKIIRHAYNKTKTDIQYKGKIDLVTNTDLECEKLLISKIKEDFPHDAILTEESKIVNKGAERKWIIDPLDGTTNFSHRFPFCAVSIGFEENGIMKYGVVYAPILNELFSAELKNGAYLNNKQIQISETRSIANALVATGFPYDRWENGEFYIKEFLAFTKRCQGVRRAGAAAIDLCYVAAGRLDGFFERKLKPWDMAAGSLIITEAGGKISTFQGSNWNYSDETILASNNKIHQKMIDILKTAHE